MADYTIFALLLWYNRPHTILEHAVIIQDLYAVRVFCREAKSHMADYMGFI